MAKATGECPLTMSIGFERPGPAGWRPDPFPSLSGINEIVYDTETTGLRWWAGDLPTGYGIGWRDGDHFHKRYLPVRHAGGNHEVEMFRYWANAELRNKRIIGLHTKFDVHQTYQDGIDLEGLGCTFHDVSHDAALLNDQDRKGFGLEDLSQKYIGRGKVKGLDVTKMKDYHANEVIAYAKEDLALTNELDLIFKPLISAEDLCRVSLLEDRVIPVVCEMERNAAPIDTEKLNAWVRESEQRLLRLLLKINKDFGVKVTSPDSREEAMRLIKSRGLDILCFTETGEASFSDDVLSLYNDPAIEMLRAARKLASLRSKYLVKYHRTVGSDGLLRYQLNQLRSDEFGTITGRFSSSGYRTSAGNEGANIQQVMTMEKQRESFGPDFIVRELFTALQQKDERTRLYLAADAKQIEYRIFGSRSGSKKILDAYARDPETDFHGIVKDMLEPFKPGLARKPVKNLNFAKLYGGGHRKIALMLELPRSESDRFIALYDREFPEVQQLLNRASRTAEIKGFVRTALGRRSRFPTRERLYKALNSIIQGDAADINKQKIVELHEERKYTQLLMSMSVHDEVTGSIPPDKEYTARVKEILDRQTSLFKVPILWSVKTGNNWSECK